MQKNRLIQPSQIFRFFWPFILLFILSIFLYGYNYTNSYLAERKHSLNNIAQSLQKRIDLYRGATYHIHDKFTDPSKAYKGEPLQETRLQPNVYFVDKGERRSNTLIFGSHDDSTRDISSSIAKYLDLRWEGSNENYAMYYLNGMDNSLTLITTQPLRDLTSRYKDNYLTTTVEERRRELLQQANSLEERESFSPLRRQRTQNSYSFALRTTFNQPGHLATVIAFDLPLDDLIPYNLARANFLLMPSDNGDMGSDNDGDENNTGSVHWQHNMLSFSVPLANAPLYLVYNVPLVPLALDLLRNNIWLLLVDLLLLLIMFRLYSAHLRNVRPNAEMATQLSAQQVLSQDIVTHLPTGLLVYDFASNTVVISNKIADHLLPHLSLKKIADMAQQHHGVIQATVNNEVYEIRIFRSRFAPDSYLFLLNDQDKEIMVNKRLQQARREYDKNVQARKLMLHNLGIELNQPLQQMHQAVQQLMSPVTPAEQAPLLQNLNKQTHAALELIDNITLLTRLETQDWQPDNQPFSMPDLFDELLSAAIPSINQKGLMLLSHYYLEVNAHYRGDVGALRKVLSMLMQYAIITTDYGKITLIVEQEPGKPGNLMIHINDTGAGLSQDEVGNLNYPFLSQTLVDRFHQGSGLTFFLCNQLCKRMNGQLVIHSKPGIGTRYTVLLTLEPLNNDEAPQEKLLDGITAKLDIRSQEVRDITSQLMQAYGATCIVNEEHQLIREYDLLLTDNSEYSDNCTLLLASDQVGLEVLSKQVIRVNFNLRSAMIEAVLTLIEQQLAASEPSSAEEIAQDTDHYRKKLTSGGYYDLFVETVPDDVKKLYTEKDHADLSALSQTVHRLKGVFAMLNLHPGKQLCESLEQYIADSDAFMIENSIGQIDSFVSGLLQQGSE